MRGELGVAASLFPDVFLKRGAGGGGVGGRLQTRTR